MGFATALLTVFFLYATAITPTTIHSFTCSSNSTCNGLASGNDLQATVAINAPQACTSMVNSTSPDYPLNLAEGNSTLTANNCVLCSCYAANETLHCQPTHFNSSFWNTCPSTKCQHAVANELHLELYLELGQLFYSGCNRTICAYAGYNNQTILTTLVSDYNCSALGNNAPKSSLQGQSWSFILISVHLLLLCLHFIQ